MDTPIGRFIFYIEILFFYCIIIMYGKSYHNVRKVKRASIACLGFVYYSNVPTGGRDAVAIQQVSTKSTGLN